MKVFYVSSNIGGCYNVRCLLPLQANGWDGDRTTFIEYRMTPENKGKAAADAQIVVFHRPDDKNKLVMARMLQKAGKKIVFDNDDTVKDHNTFKFNEFMDRERLEKGLATMNDQLDAFIKEADLVTCSTEFLKKEYDKLNPNVVVLPNCIDPFYWDEPLRNDTDIVRIGITGSVGITSDIEVLKPIIEHYNNDKRVQFVLLSMPPHKEDKITRELYFDEYKFWESVNIEWQPFVPAEEYPTVLNELRLDMVIIPRADNYFNHCKSNLKFLENSMLKIATIAQGFPDGQSPYQVDEDDAKHMIIANNYEEWISAIEDLIANPDKRRKLGEDAFDYVIGKYSIEKNARKWKKAYENLLANNKMV